MNNLILPEGQQWFSPASNGVGYVLLDPILGDRINPNTVPSYISDDPQLHAGISYLRARADEVSITIGYGKHETAENLGKVVGEGGWFEDQVRKADYYAYENIAHSIESQPHRARIIGLTLLAALKRGRDLATYIDTYTKLPDMEKESSFAMRRDRATAITSTPSFSPDVARDGTPLERSLVARSKEAEETPHSEAAAIGYMALENAREWCMVAKMGLHLLRGEAGVELRPLDVFSTVGGAHLDVARKFRTLGTTVKPKFIRPDEWRDQPIVEAISASFATGIVLPDDVPVLRRFHQQAHELTKIG